MLRKLFILIALLSGIISAVGAQNNTGQLCIQAYQDRNGNGARDANEPPIIQGISVSLADANRIILDSQLMDDSPNATTGTLCFQRLAAGQYTLRVLSADYTATTASEFVTTVSDNNSLPGVFPYGGQVVQSQVALPSADTGGDFALSPTEQQETINRLVLATIGAFFAIGVMTVIGAVIYLLFIRQGAQPAPPPRGATGQYQPLRPTTGSMQPVADPFAPDPFALPPTGNQPLADPFALPPTGNQQAANLADPFGFDAPPRTDKPRRPAEAIDDPFAFDEPGTDKPRRPAEAADAGLDTNKPVAPPEETAPPREPAATAKDPTPAESSASGEIWDDFDFSSPDSGSNDSSSDSDD